MRWGSSNSIRSRKVNEKLLPSTGTFVIRQTQCVPSSSTDWRNGVSRATRWGSVSTSHTASTSAVIVAVERLAVVKVAIRA